ALPPSTRKTSSASGGTVRSSSSVTGTRAANSRMTCSSWFTAHLLSVGVMGIGPFGVPNVEPNERRNRGTCGQAGSAVDAGSGTTQGAVLPAGVAPRVGVEGVAAVDDVLEPDDAVEDCRVHVPELPPLGQVKNHVGVAGGIRG